MSTYDNRSYMYLFGIKTLHSCIYVLEMNLIQHWFEFHVLFFMFLYALSPLVHMLCSVWNVYTVL